MKIGSGIGLCFCGCSPCVGSFFGNSFNTSKGPRFMWWAIACAQQKARRKLSSLTWPSSYFLFVGTPSPGFAPPYLVLLFLLMTISTSIRCTLLIVLFGFSQENAQNLCGQCYNADVMQWCLIALYEWANKAPSAHTRSSIQTLTMIGKLQTTTPSWDYAEDAPHVRLGAVWGRGPPAPKRGGGEVRKWQSPALNCT